MDIESFFAGNCFDAHDYFGAHPEPGGAMFRVYAPKASRVTLEGDFNGWREQDAIRVHRCIWEFFAPCAGYGQNYKYCVYSKRGKRTEHADPYAFGSGGWGCSVVRDISTYEFMDGGWMAGRSLNFEKPMNIYELHLHTWRGKNGWYPSYNGIADDLIEYLRENHYTHVEFMPLGEHPQDGSWGYQVTGFFSPTARFGEAWQLMNLIDRLHRAGFGAILDFVSVHFAVDRYGLKMFDGGALYESSRLENRRSDWGSCFFEHTRPEVRSFLKSAANYWLTVYHFDGLRFDAASHLIYSHGDPNCGENPGGIAFLREINQGLEWLHPTAMRIAEDSTPRTGVTTPVCFGGLGFHYKWAMGWSYDTLGFFFMPPQDRPGNGRRMTFALDYFGTDRFLLPLSHDIAASGPICSRMPGYGPEKLRQGKLLYLLMMTHPGKKLSFLGGDGMVAQWGGWREMNVFHFYQKGYHAFCQQLNDLYRNSPALYQADYQDWSAKWVWADDGGGVYALMRHSAGQHMLTILNTSDWDREFWFPLEGIHWVETRLHTQWPQFGGDCQRESLWVENGGVKVRLPRLSGLLAEIWF